MQSFLHLYPILLSLASNSLKYGTSALGVSKICFFIRCSLLCSSCIFLSATVSVFTLFSRSQLINTIRVLLSSSTRSLPFFSSTFLFSSVTRFSYTSTLSSVSLADWLAAVLSPFISFLRLVMVLMFLSVSSTAL